MTAPGANLTEGSTPGLFANLFYPLSEDTAFSIGVRHDDRELESTSAATAEKHTDCELQPRVTLTHFLSPDVMTYASIARDFRGGGRNGPGAPNMLYDGDSVWTYEIGSKSQLAGGRLGLNVAALYHDYKDFIVEYFESYIDDSVLERAGVPPFIISNLGLPGDQRRFGIRASYEF